MIFVKSLLISLSFFEGRWSSVLDRWSSLHQPTKTCVTDQDRCTGFWIWRCVRIRIHRIFCDYIASSVNSFFVGESALNSKIYYGIHLTPRWAIKNTEPPDHPGFPGFSCIRRPILKCSYLLSCATFLIVLKIFS